MATKKKAAAAKGRLPKTARPPAPKAQVAPKSKKKK
jgi:hypothetical protein